MRLRRSTRGRGRTAMRLPYKQFQESSSLFVSTRSAVQHDGHAPPCYGVRCWFDPSRGSQFAGVAQGRGVALKRRSSARSSRAAGIDAPGYPNGRGNALRPRPVSVQIRLPVRRLRSTNSRCVPLKTERFSVRIRATAPRESDDSYIMRVQVAPAAPIWKRCSVGMDGRP